ncbi:MAG: gamma-glutamyl-gamma-aminobutyrate hydrolase family protein [Candidatus Acidiferrales bacterium]
MNPEHASRPRVGVPYRTRKEELTSQREAYQKYLGAVCIAGGIPVEISLGWSPDRLEKAAQSVDAIILPGSPADLEPSRFHAARHPQAAEADADRERTDFALLDHAIKNQKPVLAICYGIQSLNVYLGGSLVQDIASEVETPIQHNWPKHEGAEPHHAAKFAAGSRLAQLAGSTEANVNSSHHQSILGPGKNLSVVAHAPDGVIEAVEWTGDQNWITGVQWHPERMIDQDFLAQSLFRQLMSAARKATIVNS